MPVAYIKNSLIIVFEESQWVTCYERYMTESHFTLIDLFSFFFLKHFEFEKLDISW